MQFNRYSIVLVLSILITISSLMLYFLGEKKAHSQDKLIRLKDEQITLLNESIRLSQEYAQQKSQIEKWAKRNGMDYPKIHNVRLEHEGKIISLAEYLEIWKETHTCLIPSE